MALIGMHRREFPGAMSLGLVGAAVSTLPGGAWAPMPRGGRMGGGMGHMHGLGTPIADPPVGAVLSEPILATNVSTSPGLVEVNLEARVATVEMGGVPARLLTYNGQFPGPTIRVRRGDVLKVNFTNRLPEVGGRNSLGFRRNVTNLHTHGWHVSPEEPADFVMYSLRHGESYHHEYDTSTQPGGTLCFYHTHQHGVAAEQYWAGMVGALIVEDETPSLQEFETHIPAWKDTVLVPKGGSVTMVVPVKDFDGMAMFHCHILEHEDIGMMGVWNIEEKERGRDKPSRTHGSHSSTAHPEDERESQPGPSHSH